MELLDGPQLGKITLSDPQDCLDMILEEVGRAYRLGIIHSDLSEFNVLVTEDGPKIIDWPSAVESTHPNAEELLERDVANILNFFFRKYKLQMHLNDSLHRIKVQPEAP
jgi:RIO kinase 2